MDNLEEPSLDAAFGDFLPDPPSIIGALPSNRRIITLARSSIIYQGSSARPGSLPDNSMCNGYGSWCPNGLKKSASIGAFCWRCNCLATTCRRVLDPGQITDNHHSFWAERRGLLLRVSVFLRILIRRLIALSLAGRIDSLFKFVKLSYIRIFSVSFDSYIILAV